MQPILQFKVSFRAFLTCVRLSVVVIRALLTLKIRAKKAVLDPVYSRKIYLRREEMFQCLSALMTACGYCYNYVEYFGYFKQVIVANPNPLV